jgi:hypothetical protein
VSVGQVAERASRSSAIISINAGRRPSRKISRKMETHTAYFNKWLQLFVRAVLKRDLGRKLFTLCSNQNKK